MNYVKNTWTNGDTVTAAKLNNMENGIAAVDTAQAAAFAPDITTPSNGDVIKYDSTAEKWVNGAVFAPDITNPQDGDTLVYNATQQKWVNGAGSSAEMVIPSFTATMSPQSITCDKTYAEVYAAAAQGLVPFALLTVTGMGSMTLQFDGITPATDAVAFKCSLIGTITGIIETRQYFQVLLYFNEHSRNINIATVESESPLIIDNDPEPEPDPGPSN